MLGIHADAQLVAVVALAVLLGVAGVQVLFPTLGSAPVLRSSALIELLSVCFGQVLDGRAHQRGIDDLPAAGDVAMAQQLGIDGLEQRRHPINAQALLPVPQGVAIGHVGAALDQAKALVAHAALQLELHLLVREVVQVLQDQDAHHDFGRVRRTSALACGLARKWLVNESGQVSEVDVPADELQRIAQGLDLALARFVGKQVELEGAAGGGS